MLRPPSVSLRPTGEEQGRRSAPGTGGLLADALALRRPTGPALPHWTRRFSEEENRGVDVLLVAWIIWVVLFGTVSALIWQSKGGRLGRGFLWGGLLGILGLIYVVAAKPRGPAFG